MFGIGNRANEMAARKATEEMKRLVKNVDEIQLIVIGRDGERSSVSYSFEPDGAYTRTGFEVKDEDCVKFAYMFFFTSVLKATGGR